MNKTSAVFGFGEWLMRLNPEDQLRLDQATSLQLHYGGAEANVLASLTSWGMPSALVSTLPNNPIGDAALSQLRALGVDASYIQQGPGRMGLYFLEEGTGMRDSQVVYDRAGSSFAIDTRSRDWSTLLHGGQWLHLSGITPALSPLLLTESVQAIKQAKALGLTTSFDLNYRSQLWGREQAAEALKQIMPWVDVYVGMDSDMATLFGVKPAPENANTAEYFIQEIHRMYGCKWAATTVRESISGGQIGWSALLFDGNKFYRSSRYDLSIRDRVGTGDAFTAGLIYAYQQGYSIEDALEFATAAGAWKHSVVGDVNRVSLSEVDLLIKGHRGGSIRR